MAKKVKKPERLRAKQGHFVHEDFLNLLSRRIRTLRKSRGFTSAETFAYDIEISRVGMSKYETGAFSDIRVSTLLKIIDGLGMTPAEFFAEGFELRKQTPKKG